MTTAGPTLTPAKRAVLERLKRLGPSTARRLAAELSTTDVAVRQHLAALESAGFVTAARQAPGGRGRPSVRWSLAERAAALFPDRHGELAVGLIRAIRAAGGEPVLLRVVEARSRDQAEAYRAMMPPAGASLGRRVRALAERRTAEGYMAEVVRERTGQYLLIEHHCPICDAARECTGLCRAELEVFRAVLGPDAEIERTSHLLAEGDRCVYRIRASAVQT
ncbi:MAG: helix-turn-helix transcriptional regulator [Planctomycetota bacterium]|jgi:predicted ArsR family transcriptional regulator